MVFCSRRMVGIGACLATALAFLSAQNAFAGPRPANYAKGLQNAIVNPDAESDNPVAHGPGSIITGFEAPFTVGSIDDQQGWPSSGANLPWASISTVAPDNLLQHLRLINDVSVAAGTQRLLFSPALAAQPAGPSNYSMRIKINTDLGADYDVVGQAPTQGLLTWRVNFHWSQDDSGVAPGTIFILDNPADNSGLAFIDTAVPWAGNAYKTLQVQFVPGGQIVYSYNGNVIYTDVNQGNNGTATAVEQLVFLTDNFQNAGELADMDLVNLGPSAATNGACCDVDGGCALTTAAGCSAIGSSFRGLGTTCATSICTGRCCDPDGFCQDLAPAACSALGGIASAVGTVCVPLDDGCVGRCCLPDGSCFNSGPAGCASSGGTFGGIATACGDGSQCIGRCCLANGACLPASNPAACATAGGTITLGAGCVGTTNINFSGLSVAIPDGLANPGGFGAPATNVQTVSGLTGNITDVNVDIKITHTWVGDLAVDIEHLGTIVRVIDLMGQATITGGGCGSDNLDIILDDEGTGGAIETQCNATAPAALSPPNYTPANPLSAFDGMNPNGTWTITCLDSFQADVGTLTGWSLHFANGASVCTPPCTCFGDMNGSGTVNGADINKFAQCAAGGGAGSGCQCGDMNHAGGVTAADVTLFVNALLTSTCGS